MKVRTDIKTGRGLGDTVADLAHITGMDKVAQFYERVTGKSCGCDQRRETLNQVLPLPKSDA